MDFWILECGRKIGLDTIYLKNCLLTLLKRLEGIPIDASQIAEVGTPYDVQ